MFAVQFKMTAETKTFGPFETPEEAGAWVQEAKEMDKAYTDETLSVIYLNPAK